MSEKSFGVWTLDVPDNGRAIYDVECAENAEVFEEGLTLVEAQALIKTYEEEDRRDGNYTDGFYAIRNMETMEIVEE